jgi:hypothetical protein
VLPRGAKNLKLELASARGHWGQGQLGERTVYAATFPAAQSNPLTLISYAEADGNRVSLRMP